MHYFFCIEHIFLSFAPSGHREFYWISLLTRLYLRLPFNLSQTIICSPATLFIFSFQSVFFYLFPSFLIYFSSFTSSHPHAYPLAFLRPTFSPSHSPIYTFSPLANLPPAFPTSHPFIPASSIVAFLPPTIFSSDSPTPLAVLPPTFSFSPSLYSYLQPLLFYPFINHPSAFRFLPFPSSHSSFPTSFAFLTHTFLFHIHFSRSAFLPPTFPHSPSLIPPAPFAFLPLTFPPSNSLPLPLRFLNSYLSSFTFSYSTPHFSFLHFLVHPHIFCLPLSLSYSLHFLFSTLLFSHHLSLSYFLYILLLPHPLSFFFYNVFMLNIIIKISKSGSKSKFNSKVLGIVLILHSNHLVLVK